MSYGVVLTAILVLVQNLVSLTLSFLVLTYVNEDKYKIAFAKVYLGI